MSRWWAVVAIWVIMTTCIFAFFTAGVTAVLNHIMYVKVLRKEWAKQGVRLRFFWSPSRYSLRTPDADAARKRASRVGLLCLLVAFLAMVVFALLSAFARKYLGV